MLTLFVYGTLRSPAQNPFAILLRSRAVLLGLARVRGVLYHLGEYPGLVVSNAAGWVRGEVYRLTDEQLLIELDEYEGSSFERVSVDALLDSGATERCWAYVYRGDVSDRAVIPSGDYFTESPEPRA
jgi:gamma-glutamylcyclotransferase (GGCT)/AIG2-like uncharacterized protein YtfP